MIIFLFELNFKIYKLQVRNSSRKKTIEIKTLIFYIVKYTFVQVYISDYGPHKINR